jgi:hypothetical protein
MSATANQKARAFLAAFRLTGDITRAAKAAQMERTLHYRWLRDSDAYKKDFAQASEEFGDALEGEAVRRANEGVLEAVFYQGAPCGAIRVYSDGLMQFLLKGFKPAKYAQRVSAELSGPGGGPIVIADPDLTVLTDDELAALIATTAKLEAAQRAPGRAHTP